MTDNDKPETDEPTEEPEVAEPKTEEADSGPTAPTDDTSAPTDDTSAPAGTDQQGRQLYDVKCADCGKQTQVPFKPSGDRPVYCRDCYMKRRAGR
jgi:CxxC-x17-CxxC domain-containing protein